jgi:purine-binding chemotaxis protein CheW
MMMQGQMVMLGCGDDLFAVPVARVQEILDLCPISPLPHAPAHLLGLIDVRGDSIAVADLRMLLGRAVAADSLATRIVVLWVTRAGRQAQIALKADRVIEVAQLDEGSIGPVPEKGLLNWSGRMVAAIGRRNGSFVTVLDLDRMFVDVDRDAEVVPA